MTTIPRISMRIWKKDIPIMNRVIPILIYHFVGDSPEAGMRRVRVGLCHFRKISKAVTLPRP